MTALHFYEETFDKDHPEIMSIKHNLCKIEIYLAELFSTKGDLEKASELAAEVITSLKQKDIDGL